MQAGLTLDYAAQLVDERFLELNVRPFPELRLEHEKLAYLLLAYRPPLARDLCIARPPALRL